MSSEAEREAKRYIRSAPLAAGDDPVKNSRSRQLDLSPPRPREPVILVVSPGPSARERRDEIAQAQRGGLWTVGVNYAEATFGGSFDDLISFEPPARYEHGREKAVLGSGSRVLWFLYPWKWVEAGIEAGGRRDIRRVWIETNAARFDDPGLDWPVRLPLFMTSSFGAVSFAYHRILHLKPPQFPEGNIWGRIGLIGCDHVDHERLNHSHTQRINGEFRKHYERLMKRGVELVNLSEISVMDGLPLWVFSRMREGLP